MWARTKDATRRPRKLVVVFHLRLLLPGYPGWTLTLGGIFPWKACVFLACVRLLGLGVFLRRRGNFQFASLPPVALLGVLVADIVSLVPFTSTCIGFQIGMPFSPTVARSLNSTGSVCDGGKLAQRTSSSTLLGCSVKVGILTHVR